MEYFAVIVSLELSSVRVVDGTGKIIPEKKVASEPEALVAWLKTPPRVRCRSGCMPG